MTIKGLRYQDTANARKMVEELVRKTFQESSGICVFIESRSTAPIDEAIASTLNI